MYLETCRHDLGFETLKACPFTWPLHDSGDLKSICPGKHGHKRQRDYLCPRRAEEEGVQPGTQPSSTIFSMKSESLKIFRRYGT